MNTSNRERKWIAWCVIFTFFFLLQASSAPIRTENDGPGSVEKASPPKAAAKKKSILPWILVGVGVVAVGAAVYFLVLNKKYTLKVDLGEGVSGTPSSGSQKYKKGTTVNYSFSISGGYKDLAVTLDGAPVAASGSVTMNADHTLAATSTKVADIAVNSTPAGALIYDNGANTGRQTNTVLEYAAAGLHDILLRLCGYQDFEQTVQAQMGQQQTVNASLKTGIFDHFEIAELASCWKSGGAGKWSFSGGHLKGAIPNSAGLALLYDVPFNVENATFMARTNVLSGSVTATLQGLLLSEGKDLEHASGYMFIFYLNQTYIAMRLYSFNAYTLAGSGTSLMGGYASVNGLNNWNAVKIVRSGNTYAFSINDTLLTTVTDTSYNPKYTSYFFGSQYAMEALVDYVRQDIGGAPMLQPRPASGILLNKPIDLLQLDRR